MVKVPVKVIQSPHGRGLAASKVIKKGVVVIEIKGKRFNWQVTKKWKGPMQNNTVRFGPETFLSPYGDLSELINHNCEPNTRIVKKDGKLYAQAIRQIRAGEELNFDYSTVLARDDIWTMKCACRAKTCRQIIKKYTTLPSQLLVKYKIEQIIPSYILRI